MRYLQNEKIGNVMKKDNLQKILTELKENNFEPANAIDYDSLAMHISIMNHGE